MVAFFVCAYMAFNKLSSKPLMADDRTEAFVVSSSAEPPLPAVGMAITEDLPILENLRPMDDANNVKSADWNLVLANKDNPLKGDYIPELKNLSNGLQFDKRAIDALNEMLTAAKNEGLSPIVCSAYRSIEKQESLYIKQVERELAKGLSRGEAEAEAAKTVAAPGTSEHNSGLAADIVSINYQLLDEAQADTPELKWLIENCSKYGFILRYPQNKTDITGVIYEPWHFRYVGKEAAAEIMEKGICLEEYLS